MSEEIVVRKSGIYRRRFDAEEVKVNSYIPYLNKTIEIEPEVTFSDFFLPIISNVSIYSEVFASHLGYFNLNDWVSDFNKQSDTTDDFIDFNLKYLQVYWEVDIDDNTVDIISGFDGIGTDKHNNVHSLGIELSPLSMLKKYPLIFNTDITFSKYTTTTKLTNYFKSKRAFRVYDVIGAILFEISFFGTPIKRDERKDEFLKQMDEIEENFDEMIDDGRLTRLDNLNDISK